MAGIALGTTEIPKIAIGTTEIQKVSLGTTLLWQARPPIEFVNWNQANATTVGTATHAVGDLLVIAGWRALSILPGDPGSPWTTADTETGGSVGSRLASKIATATNDASGTWTGASHLENANYRYASGIGATAFDNGTGSSIVYPSLTLTDPGNSWVLRIGWHGNASDFTSATLTGHTRRAAGSASVGQYVIWDTNGEVSSAPSVTQTTGAGSGTWRVWSIEILRA